MKKPSKIKDLRKAEKQEHDWMISAFNEGECEHKRAKKYKKKGFVIMAKELEWDAKNANLWGNMRMQRSKHYLELITKEKQKDNK